MPKLETLSFTKLHIAINEKLNEAKKSLKNEKRFVKRSKAELNARYEISKERYKYKKRDAKMFYKKYKKGTITPAEKDEFFALLRRQDW